MKRCLDMDWLSSQETPVIRRGRRFTVDFWGTNDGPSRQLARTIFGWYAGGDGRFSAT